MLHENEDVTRLKFRSLQQLILSKFEPWSDTNDLHLKKEERSLWQEAMWNLIWC